MTTVFLAGVVLSLVGALPAAAQCHTSYPVVVPTTLVKPGCYTLAGSITTASGPGSRPAIVISGSDIYLDLSGYAINVTTLNDPGIRVDPGLRNVTIRNGAINGGSRAIEVVGDATNLVVEDLRIFAPAYEAVLVPSATNLVFRRNEIFGGSAVAFGDQAAYLHTATIEDNLLQDAGGIRVTNAIGVAVRGNRVYHDASAVANHAIGVKGSESFEVAGNTVATVLSGNGINVEDSREGRIVDNVIRNASGHGISLQASDNCSLLENVSGTNVLTGIRVEGRHNRIERNQLNMNGQSGLWLEGTAGYGLGNTYGRNSCTSSGTLPGSCSSSVCDPAAICDDGPSNLSFGDNLDGSGPC
jgi:parallel beta-helix repeat protein